MRHRTARRPRRATHPLIPRTRCTHSPMCASAIASTSPRQALCVSGGSRLAWASLRWSPRVGRCIARRQAQAFTSPHSASSLSIQDFVSVTVAPPGLTWSFVMTTTAMFRCSRPRSVLASELGLSGCLSDIQEFEFGAVALALIIRDPAAPPFCIPVEWPAVVLLAPHGITALSYRHPYIPLRWLACAVRRADRRARFGKPVGHTVVDMTQRSSSVMSLASNRRKAAPSGSSLGAA